MNKIFRVLLISAFFFMSVFPGYHAAAEEAQYIIYKVTASSLVVRSGQDAKSQALFNVPKGSYVFSSTSMQSQAVVEIAGRKGRWINYCGFYGDNIGYVFEGFLERDDSVKHYNLESCGLNGMTIKCGSEVFKYTADTPISGSYFSKPETESGDSVFFYDKKSGLLNKIREIGGGNFIFLVKDGKVVQFIVTPPGRGYE